ncbi:hypothetical protein [Candidatus Absconditicoccus praedator]|uniref:hypothetical protein n=1 Tax=Candidatus Absconditicoccus praedator TaxID=2735562 RepID=UPI001E49C6CB|nr:hypothetical protein [Candidatus Absconditicoccus praedator]UFX83099.1 hypothetical protein HLG78_03120 [Candidatus Absconditicoccus praedator]
MFLVGCQIPFLDDDTEKEIDLESATFQPIYESKLEKAFENYSMIESIYDDGYVGEELNIEFDGYVGDYFEGNFDLDLDVQTSTNDSIVDVNSLVNLALLGDVMMKEIGQQMEFGVDVLGKLKVLEGHIFGNLESFDIISDDPQVGFAAAFLSNFENQRIKLYDLAELSEIDDFDINMNFSEGLQILYDIKNVLKNYPVLDSDSRAVYDDYISFDLEIDEDNLKILLKELLEDEEILDDIVPYIDKVDMEANMNYYENGDVSINIDKISFDEFLQVTGKLGEKEGNLSFDIDNIGESFSLELDYTKEDGLCVVNGKIIQDEDLARFEVVGDISIDDSKVKTDFDVSVNSISENVEQFEFNLSIQDEVYPIDDIEIQKPSDFLDIEQMGQGLGF